MSSAASVTAVEATGFAIWATRVVLSATEDQFLVVASANLPQLAFEQPSAMTREG